MSTEIIISNGSPGVTLIELSGQGPQGPEGPPGANTVSVTAIADQALGGHRVIKVTPTGCDYADSSNLSDFGKVIGITDSAFSGGASVTIFSQKLITEPSWNFALGPVFLSTNGTLTQVAPTSGFIQQVGVALSPTELLINLYPPIKVI